MAIPVAMLGWMAGIIDLKGRLLFKHNKQRATRQILLAVDSTDINIIRKMSSFTGTKPELKEAAPIPAFMRKGCAEHCPESHVHVNEELIMPRTARWTITGAGMVVVLSNLDPFLSVDRNYDETVIEVIASTPMTGQGSGMVRASLTRLRDLGWDLPAVYEKALKQKEEESDGEGQQGGSEDGEAVSEVAGVDGGEGPGDVRGGGSLQP